MPVAIVTGFLAALLLPLLVFVAFPRFFGFPDIRVRLRHAAILIARTAGFTIASPFIVLGCVIARAFDHETLDYSYFRRAVPGPAQPTPRLHRMLQNTIRRFNASVFSRVERVSLSDYNISITSMSLPEGVAGRCKWTEHYGVPGFHIGIDKSQHADMEGVQQTVNHEVAHVVMFTLIGMHGHDELWQRAFEACGGTYRYWGRMCQSKRRARGVRSDRCPPIPVVPLSPLPEAPKRTNRPETAAAAPTGRHRAHGDYTGYPFEADEDLSDWEYASDGKRLCFVHIHSGRRVYFEDPLFHVLKRKMLHG